MSDPTDDQKPQPDSADSGLRPSSNAPEPGSADAPDADRTRRISRDELPGAANAEGRTEHIPRDAGGQTADGAATERIARDTAAPPAGAPRPEVGRTPLPQRPGVAPSPPPPVPPRPGPPVPPAAPQASPNPAVPPVNRDSAGSGADAETRAIPTGRAAASGRAPDHGATDKTEFIPKSGPIGAATPPGSGEKPSGATGSDATEGKTEFIRRPAASPTGAKPSAPAESAPAGDRPGPGDKAMFIPKSALQGAGGESSADAETVAMPSVPNASDAETTALPIQRPGTDRVTPPPGGRAPITKPPTTPRAGSGPKNSGPQGPSGPHNVPAGQGAPPMPPQPGSAPSPADAQPTIPASSMSSQTTPLSAPQDAPQPPAPSTPDAQQTQVIAAPQRIPGATAPAPDGASKRPGRRWLLAAGAALVLVVVVIAVVVALVAGGRDNSPEAKVKAAIGDYTKALATGNLPELQAATCGAQHDFYQSIAPDQYASVHKLAVDQRKIPKVDAVDSVQITGDKAVAQASVYTDADPTRVARTFDLQNSGGGWKVCGSP